MRSRSIAVCAIVCCCLSAALHALDVVSLKAKAESGDVKAQLALGQAYEKGEGVAQNDEQAAKWYRAAAEKGDPQAQNELGVLYSRGVGVPRDKVQAFEWYSRSAVQGYGPGRFNLAASYYNGDGVGIDDSLAYAWFRLAAVSGSKEAAEAVTRMETELSAPRLDGAKLVLARLLIEGREVPKDTMGGFELTREVADHGDRHAQFSVGTMYAEGVGTGQNMTSALKYLTASAIPEALSYLADIYLEGRGVPRDPKKAIEWLEKASTTESHLRVAKMYWNGDGVPQDYKKAIKHYELANLSGNATALYWTGIAYRDGLGVRKNDGTACMYFVIAANFHSPEALSIVQQECPGEKLKSAKKKAIEYLREHRWNLPRPPQQGN